MSNCEEWSPAGTRPSGLSAALQQTRSKLQTLRHADHAHLFIVEAAEIKRPGNLPR
jgi:hypothetical protein